MQVINRAQITVNSADYHYEALVESQEKTDNNYETLRNYNSVPRGFTVMVLSEDGDCGPMEPSLTKVTTTTKTCHIEYR